MLRLVQGHLRGCDAEVDGDEAAHEDHQRCLQEEQNETTTTTTTTNSFVERSKSLKLASFFTALTVDQGSQTTRPRRN